MILQAVNLGVRISTKATTTLSLVELALSLSRPGLDWSLLRVVVQPSLELDI